MYLLRPYSALPGNFATHCFFQTCCASHIRQSIEKPAMLFQTTWNKKGTVIKGKHPEGVPLYIPFISIRICTDDICGQCGFFQLQDLTSFPRWSSCNETGSQRSWVILFDSLASFLASGLFVAVSYLHRLPAWGSNWYLWWWWWSLPDVSQDCGQ